MANKRNHAATIPVDPVLPDQGGRMTEAEPGRVAQISEEVVRRRAYEIYEMRGRTDGRALDDWLAAESERGW